MVKQTAFSCSGGTGALPTVKSASSDHKRTAEKPMRVAPVRDMERSARN